MDFHCYFPNTQQLVSVLVQCIVNSVHPLESQCVLNDIWIVKHYSNHLNLKWQSKAIIELQILGHFDRQCQWLHTSQDLVLIRAKLPKWSWQNPKIYICSSRLFSVYLIPMVLYAIMLHFVSHFSGVAKKPAPQATKPPLPQKGCWHSRGRTCLVTSVAK